MQFKFSYTTPFLFITSRWNLHIPFYALQVRSSDIAKLQHLQNMVPQRDLTVMVEKIVYLLSEMWMSKSHSRGVRSSFSLACWGNGSNECINELLLRVKGRHLVKLPYQQLQIADVPGLWTCMSTCRQMRSNQTILES